MELSAFRINQVGYSAGLPVRVAVLEQEPVTLESEDGKTVYRANNIRLRTARRGNSAGKVLSG